MRRPGYLADWENDLRTYLKNRYPGWQPGPLPTVNMEEPYSEHHLPQQSWECPVGYHLHQQHGCLPEEALINVALKNF